MKYYEVPADMIKETMNKLGPSVRVHKVEWERILRGDPVEISPSTGSGQKVMTVVEWSERWKTNKDDPSLSKCLCCKGTNTKEHHFSQTWCRGSVKWESEILCLDCFTFSKREFSDPKFKTPQQHEKEQWEGMAQV